MSSVSKKIADYAVGLTYEQIPMEVVHEVKRCLIDSLGCTIGGYSSDSSVILQNLTREFGGPAESTIIGSGSKTSCPNAILVNGAMLRYLDYLDSYVRAFRTSKGIRIMALHSCENIPVALAVGERLHATGKEVITAITLGYELAGRFCDSVGASLSDRGFRHTTFASFIVPAVTGKVLGLNVEQIMNAIGISGSLLVTLGVVDTEGEENTMTKNIAYAFPAECSVMATLLAQRGFTGPERVIEGNKGLVQSVMGGVCDLERLTKGEEKFKILETNRKSFAATGQTQPLLTATLKLVKEHNIKAEDVEEVKVWTGPNCVEHTFRRFPPPNRESADHSTPYLVAVAIIDGEVGLDQFTIKKLRDTKVHDLMRRVVMEADPELDKPESYGFAAIVEVKMKQGVKYSCQVDYNKGHFRNPMSDEELQAKFKSLASRYMSDEHIKEIIDAINNFERIDEVNRFMELLIF